MKKTLFLALLLTSTFAHKLNIFAYIEEDKLFINTYFASGSPCKHCTVFINNKPLGETDEKGDFVTLADTKKIFIEVDAGSGHKSKEYIEHQNFKEAKKQQKEEEKREGFNKLLGVVLIAIIFSVLWFFKRKK